MSLEVLAHRPSLELSSMRNHNGPLQYGSLTRWTSQMSRDLITFFTFITGSQNVLDRLHFSLVPPNNEKTYNRLRQSPQLLLYRRTSKLLEKLAFCGWLALSTSVSIANSTTPVRYRKRFLYIQQNMANDIGSLVKKLPETWRLGGRCSLTTLTWVAENGVIPKGDHGVQL